MKSAPKFIEKKNDAQRGLTKQHPLMMLFESVTDGGSRWGTTSKPKLVANTPYTGSATLLAQLARRAEMVIQKFVWRPTNMGYWAI